MLSDSEAQASSLGGREPRTLSQKEATILIRHPLDHHWRAPSRSERFGTLRWTVFHILCLTAYGHLGLEPVWASIKLEEEGDESVWAEGRRKMCERLNVMLVVASLLLATSAVFITTAPPEASMLNYTLRGPYICLLSSFALLIGGITAASVAYLVASRARAGWAQNVLYATRFHVYSMLIMLSYPLFSIGLASLLLAFGILSAVWSANDRGIQAGAAVLLFLPFAIAVLCAVSWAAAAVKDHLQKESPSIELPTTSTGGAVP
ncbi:hypothetical protein DFH09DRAFT_1200406 [Mycena vulgaris]|nr:hypothetical protein DFH09DRAFT_1200406 [Mycena vulgaris]